MCKGTYFIFSYQIFSPFSSFFFFYFVFSLFVLNFFVILHPSTVLWQITINKTIMKHNTIKLMLPLLLCFVSLSVSAHDFEMDGIYYNITSTEELTVGVTYVGGLSDLDTSYSGNVTIPESVKYEGETYHVTSIGNKAFSKCSLLLSVSIPESITNIGDSAFYQCSSLQKVIVPNLAAWCIISFADKYSNPLYYAKHFYSDANTEIRDLIIPEGVRKIGNYAFENGLFQTVTIPGSVEDVWI